MWWYGIPIQRCSGGVSEVEGCKGRWRARMRFNPLLDECVFWGNVKVAVCAAVTTLDVLVHNVFQEMIEVIDDVGAGGVKIHG